MTPCSIFGYCAEKVMVMVAAHSLIFLIHGCREIFWAASFFFSETAFWDSSYYFDEIGRSPSVCNSTVAVTTVRRGATLLSSDRLSL